MIYVYYKMATICPRFFLFSINNKFGAFDEIKGVKYQSLQTYLVVNIIACQMTPFTSCITIICIP